MAKVLFLASWYPSRIDFLNGDFVERHANAIALMHEVTVIFVSKDLQLSNKLYEFDYEEKGRVKLYKAYYREFRSRFSILRKIVSQWRYLKCLHKLYLKALRQQGKPDLIHLYIPFKAGIYALYLKFLKKIKYVISEQHSYYMPASNKYEEQSVITKWLIKLIFRNAAAVHTVSQALGEILIKKNIIKGNYHVIPNVVNVDIFYPEETACPSGITRFVTITGNIFHKNTDGVIRAFKKVLNKRNDFTLDIIGPNIESLKVLSEESGLSNNIHFHGPVSYENVAKTNRQSDAMIFFTRYETFGCVIIEANACGLPVIVSDLPVTRENVIENFNGIYVTPEDENDLAEKVLWYMDNKDKFNKQEIAFFAKNKFNYKVVGSHFDEWYKEVLIGTH